MNGKIEFILRKLYFEDYGIYLGQLNKMAEDI